MYGVNMIKNFVYTDFILISGSNSKVKPIFLLDKNINYNPNKNKNEKSCIRQRNETLYDTNRILVEQ